MVCYLNNRYLDIRSVDFRPRSTTAHSYLLGWLRNREKPTTGSETFGKRQIPVNSTRQTTDKPGEQIRLRGSITAHKIPRTPNYSPEIITNRKTKLSLQSQVQKAQPFINCQNRRLFQQLLNVPQRGRSGRNAKTVAQTTQLRNNIFFLKASAV